MSVCPRIEASREGREPIIMPGHYCTTDCLGDEVDVYEMPVAVRLVVKAFHGELATCHGEGVA